MLLSNTNKKKNFLVFFFAFFVVSGTLFLAQTQVAHASWAWLGLDNVFKTLLVAIFTMFGWLASLALSIFEWAIDPKDVILLFNSPGVYESWKFVRDFFNLFFILVLLYIAFTVVFQIQKNFKQALLSLILAALFVNFSFPISRVLIDATNVPMYFFANQMGARSVGQGTGIFGGTMTASHIKGILIPGGENGGSVDTDEVGVARLLMAIVFMFLFSVTLLVLSIMFMIRLVALVVLVIFSSVGFAAAIIPGMESYSKMWWDNFWKYALFGPAAMLMILVATRFFASIGGDSGVLMESMKSITAGTTVASEQTFFASMALFSIPIIMLWMTIGLGQKFSIAGAASISGKGEKFAKWFGRSVTVVPALWAGRKLDSKLAEGKVSKYFSPGAWRAAIKNREEEQKHKDEQPIKLAAATMQDQLNAGISRVKNTILPTSWRSGTFMANTDHTDHRFEERQKQKNAVAKEITEVSDRASIVIGKMQNAIAAGDAAEVEAAIGILARNNDLNDMIMAVGQEYGGTNEVSSDNAKLVLANILRQSGVTDVEDIAKSLTVLSDQALASGNYAFGGMSNYDQATQTFDISTPAQQAAQVAGKFNNLDPQKQAIMLHPDALFKRNAAGFTDMNDTIADAIVPNISKATADQSNRARPDMREALRNSWEQVTLHGRGADFPNFVRNYNSNLNFRHYVGKMLEADGHLPAGVAPNNVGGTMPPTI